MRLPPSWEESDYLKKMQSGMEPYTVPSRKTAIKASFFELDRFNCQICKFISLIHKQDYPSEASGGCCVLWCATYKWNRNGNNHKVDDEVGNTEPKSYVRRFCALNIKIRKRAPVGPESRSTLKHLCEEYGDGP
jgi:hypothetical protein